MRIVAKVSSRFNMAIRGRVRLLGYQEPITCCLDRWSICKLLNLIMRSPVPKADSDVRSRRLFSMHSFSSNRGKRVEKVLNFLDLEGFGILISIYSDSGTSAVLRSPLHFIGTLWSEPPRRSRFRLAAARSS